MTVDRRLFLQGAMQASAGVIILQSNRQQPLTCRKHAGREARWERNGRRKSKGRRRMGVASSAKYRSNRSRND